MVPWGAIINGVSKKDPREVAASGGMDRERTSDMTGNTNTNTATDENLFDLHAALIDRGADVDFATDSYDLSDLLKVWDDDRETYTLVGEARDENYTPMDGFQWSRYEVIDDGSDQNVGGEGYASTVAEAVAYLAGN